MDWITLFSILENKGMDTGTIVGIGAGSATGLGALIFTIIRLIQSFLDGRVKKDPKFADSSIYKNLSFLIRKTSEIEKLIEDQNKKLDEVDHKVDNVTTSDAKKKTPKKKKANPKT